MRRSTLAVHGLLLAAAVVTGCRAAQHSSANRFPLDPHGDPGVPQGRIDQILNATTAVNSSTSQDQLAAEGKAVFESTAPAKSGEACAGCHVNGGGVNAKLGLIVHPIKPGDFTGPRTPIQLWGVAHTAPYAWTGAVPTLEQQVTNTILTFFVAGKTQPIATTAQQVAEIVAYLKTLEPPRSAFDNGTLSSVALQGEELFRGKGGCASCHSGPYFSDNRIHNIGVPQAQGANDPGAAVPPGGFNTPGLRDVKDSGPYMHNGAFATLDDVLKFYSGNHLAGVPQLSGPERDAIIAYLNSL
jgi:cytochrome c peroxidase